MRVPRSRGSHRGPHFSEDTGESWSSTRGSSEAGSSGVGSENILGSDSACLSPSFSRASAP